VERQRNPWNERQMVSCRAPEGAKESFAPPGLRIRAIAYQGLRCASPLATIDRRSAAAPAAEIQP